jgi:hypothetical protein
MVSEKQKIIRGRKKMKIAFLVENMLVNRLVEGKGVDAAKHWQSEGCLWPESEIS